MAVVALFFVLAQIASSGSDYFVSQWANWEESVANRTAVIERIAQNATFESTTTLNESVTNTAIDLLAVTASPTSFNVSTLNDTTVLTSTLASILNSTVASAVQIAANETSAFDTEDEEAINEKREKFMLTYAIIMMVGTCVYIYRSFSFFRLCLRVSINMHDKLFRGITRARMIFFNNNPSGRILNRFARDISNVDSLLPVVLIDVIDVSEKSSFYVKNIQSKPNTNRRE